MQEEVDRLRAALAASSRENQIMSDRLEGIKAKAGGATSPSLMSSPARRHSYAASSIAAEIQAGSPHIQRLQDAHYRRRSSLRQTVEALINENPDNVEELEELLKEKWSAVTQAADDLEAATAEVDRLREDKEEMMSMVDMLKNRCEDLQQEVERLSSEGEGAGAGRRRESRALPEASGLEEELRREISNLQGQLAETKIQEEEKSSALLEEIRMYEAALQSISSDNETQPLEDDDVEVRGRDLIERVLCKMDALKDIAAQKEAQSIVLEEGILMALEEFGSRARPGPAHELINRLSRALEALKFGLTKERDRLDRLLAPTEDAQAVIPTSPTDGHHSHLRQKSSVDVKKAQQQQQLQPVDSKPLLIERLEDYVSQVKGRVGNMNQKLEEVKRVNIADRRLLQEEFEQLKAQVADWDRESHEVEKAVIVVLQEFTDTRRLRTKELGPTLKAAVASLRGELDERCLQIETVTREAEATRNILESEVNEVKAEVVLLRKLMASYEEALWTALGVEGGPQGKELAIRLRDHVDDLKRQVEERGIECEEMRKERTEERSGYLTQIQALRQQASMYGRFTESFREAVRTVLGMELCERRQKSTEGERTQQQQHVTEECDLTTEEVKALCIKILQYGSRVQGETEQNKEKIHGTERQLRTKDKEILELKKKLSLQGVELSSLHDKVKSSSEEMATLRARLVAQDDDISTLVSSMTKVSDKLHLLQSEKEIHHVLHDDDDIDDVAGEASFAASSSASTRGVFPLETSLKDAQTAKKRDSGRLTVSLLEESLAKNYQELVQARAAGEKRLAESFAGVASSSSYSLLSEAEDPLNGILSRRGLRSAGAASSYSPSRSRRRQFEGSDDGPFSRSQIMMEEAERNVALIGKSKMPLLPS